MGGQVHQMAKVIEGWSVRLRSADQFAYTSARRTPITMVISLTLLFAGVIGSRLNLWIEGFLWGIPSLGAISLGIGLWIFSSSILQRPDLSAQARTTLQRAMKLQWVMVSAGALTLVYFFGMAAGLW
ncbi:MAG: hypothetical protein HC893_03635 [Chloroflexaceae bacterium]|nr:hypothetical protein [Chloroflexaceae bacterium]